METAFDFTMTGMKCVYNISSNTNVCIERMTHSVAALYFTDEHNNKINIPDNIVVYTYDYQNTQKKVVQDYIDNTYHLCWTDSYTIEFNKTILINIKNQRKWVIS